MNPGRPEAPPIQRPIMFVLLGAMYVLLHPYLGLVHDSRIYALQALNVLHPDLYGTDVYLKFGSQDSYTLFSPLYAALMSLVGTEGAASVLTLCSNLAVLCGAWWLARSLMPSRLSYLAVGLLIIIPGFYSPDEFFAVLEGFLTPRQLAQALVLFGTAAWLRKMYWTSTAFFTASLLVHPLMAVSGILLLLACQAVVHPRRVWFLALAIGPIVGAGLFYWLVFERWRFDPEWWPMVGRENLLLLGEWSPADWARIATVLATLGVAAIVLRDSARRIATGLILVSVATLMLSWVGGDLLRIVLVVQGQAWRSLWLATAVAALLLVPLTAVCWHGSAQRRVVLLFLAAAWIVGHQSLAFAFIIPSLVAVALDRVPIPAPFSRIAVLGAVVVLAVTALCSLAFTFNDVGARAASRAVIESIREACSDGLLPCVVLIGIWYLTTVLSSTRRRIILMLAVSLPTAGVAIASAQSWLERRYSPEAYEAFASWRALIPPGSDVLWATDLIPGSDPSAVWLLLERPSFYSSVQVNSALFSRDAALELQKRNQALPVSLPTEQTVNIVYGDHLGLPPNCWDLPVAFVITDIPINGARPIAAPPAAPPPFDRLTLQVCP